MSVPFTITAIATDGYDISYTNSAAAGAQIVFELNRAADFASDDTILISLTAPFNGSNTVTLRGLPNDTPFYIRAVNLTANGAYSDVQFVMTGMVAPDASFAGYSIEPAAIIVPADLQGITAVPAGGTTALAAFPPSNLLLDDPQSTFQAQSTGTMSVAIRFTTSGEPLDTFALLGTLAGASMSVTVSAYTNSGYGTVAFTTGAQTLRASPSVGRRNTYHGMVKLATPRTDRFWAIIITGPARHFLARNLVAGLARQSINASKGHGVSAADLGTAGRNRFGVVDGVPGWRARTVDFELSWLREAEYHAKFADLPGLVGSTKSVLALVNPKRNLFLQDRFAFGPMTSFRAETPSSKRNTMNVEVNSLY